MRGRTNERIKRLLLSKLFLSLKTIDYEASFVCLVINKARRDISAEWEV